MSASTTSINPAQPIIKSKKSKSKYKGTTSAEAPSTAPLDVIESTTNSAPVLPTNAEPEQPVEDVRVSSSKKGPVEEMISKRLRLLGKKIQRFKAYSSSPVEKLNADQVAALASLPTLEGGWKELDDVMKFVEIIELEQASKVREQKVESEKNLENLAAAKVAAFQTDLANPLSQFLRLHTLLHPARSSDQRHLTFGPLTLPSSLQDEVEATDILRVGRMYEDLLAGGEQGQKVLDSLVNKGEDEEGERIQHLLALIDQTEPEIVEEGNDESQTEIEAEEEQAEDQQTAEVLQPTSVETSRAASVVGQVNGLPNGHGEINFLSNEGGDETSSTIAVDPTPGPEATLNFLQDDELERDIEDGYEVLDLPPSHETSGLQPPPIEEAIAEAQTTAPSFPPASAHFDWAADEDLDDSIEAEKLRSAFNTSGAITPAIQPPPSSAPAPVLAPTSIQPDPQSATIPSSSEPALPAPISAPSSATTKDPKSTSTSPTQAKQNRRKPSTTTTSQASQQQAQKQGGKKNEPITVIDEDGFEMKVRRQAPAARGRGFARGGAGGAGAGAGAGGRGNGRGRGGPRIPSTRTPNNPSSNSTNPSALAPPLANNHNGSSQNGNKQARPPHPQNGTPSTGALASTKKGSIYKTEQPKGPASAPIF